MDDELTPKELAVEQKRVEGFNRGLQGKDEQIQRLDKVIEALEKLNKTQQEQKTRQVNRNAHR